jgi:hypothetical protein
MGLSDGETPRANSHAPARFKGAATLMCGKTGLIVPPALKQEQSRRGIMPQHAAKAAARVGFSDERANAPGTTIPRPPTLGRNPGPECLRTQPQPPSGGSRPICDPFLGDTLGAAQAVSTVEPHAGGHLARISLGFPVGGPAGGYAGELETALRAHLRAAGINTPLSIELVADILAHSVQKQLKPLVGIKNIVAVASGKGGVGKSTVAVNIALAWAAQGARVGLLDADIYGPSQPLMLGLEGQRPGSPDGKTLIPLKAHGITAMSIGFLVDAGQPMGGAGRWLRALAQLLSETQGAARLPGRTCAEPGTSLFLNVPVSGASS